MSTDSSTEYAEAGRDIGQFPVEWGCPVGRRFSDERAAWIRTRIAEHAALTAHRRLADRDAKMLVQLHQAALNANRVGPE